MADDAAMANCDAVARDMERIFGDATPADARALIADRRGSVAAWTAGAVALVGTAAAAWLLPAPKPPATAPVAPPTRVATPVAPPPPVAAPTPRPTVAREPRHTPVRKAVRPRRPVATPQPAPTLEAPRLYGEALRRALAEDVIITRRLNREALERDRSRE